MGFVSVPDDKRRARPFLTELALALALLWAALGWIGGGSDERGRLALRNLPPEPATTGSVSPRGAHPAPAEGAAAPEGAVRSLLDAAVIVGRR